MRFLLDTGIMGDFINHRRGVDVRVRAERKNGAIIGTCVPVAGELFFGVEASRSRDINFARLVLNQAYSEREKFEERRKPPAFSGVC